MPRKARGPYLQWNPDRGRWYILFRENGRTRERSTGSSDREEANCQLAEFILQQQRKQGPTGPRDPSKFPIQDALALYGAEQAPHVADPKRIGYAIAALLPFWGNLKVSDIRRETCGAYGRQRGKKPGTIRRELACLRAALNYTKHEGCLTYVPTVHLPPKPEGKDRWLTRSEAAALLNAARKGHESTRGYLPLFILIGLYTGARRGAVLSLRWPQVNFAIERINFNEPGRERTTKGRAHLPIPKRLLTFLKLARRRGSDLGYVVHRDGKRIASLKRAFNAACAEAGLTNVTPHTLRHTCGTWLAQDGVDLDKIGGWLGHTDAQTTQLYRHHHPGYMKDALLAIDRRRA
jgi:integrase